MSLASTLLFLVGVSVTYGAGIVNGRYLGRGWPFAQEAGKGNAAKIANNDGHDHDTSFGPFIVSRWGRPTIVRYRSFFAGNFQWIAIAQEMS